MDPPLHKRPALHPSGQTWQDGHVDQRARGHAHTRGQPRTWWEVNERWEKSCNLSAIRWSRSSSLTLFVLLTYAPLRLWEIVTRARESKKKREREKENTVSRSFLSRVPPINFQLTLDSRISNYNRREDATDFADEFLLIMQRSRDRS